MILHFFGCPENKKILSYQKVYLFVFIFQTGCMLLKISDYNDNIPKTREWT